LCKRLAIISFSDTLLVHCHDLNTLSIGVAIKLFFNKKVKVVYDAHEYETETVYLKGVERILAKAFERISIRKVDAVITVSESIASAYRKLYNIKKPFLVKNYPYYCKVQKNDEFREIFKIHQNTIIYLYQGGFYPKRGIENILKAFNALRQENKAVVFMGSGPLENLIVNESNQNNIFFLKEVDQKNLLKYTFSADFGLCLTQNESLNHQYSLPNKLFEYIMARIPVIVSNLYEMKKLVVENGIGVISENDTTVSLLKAIKKSDALDLPKIKKNLEVAAQKYRWETQAKILLDVYRNL